MTRQLERDWAGEIRAELEREWAEPVRVVEVTEVRFRYRVRGRHRDGAETERWADADAVADVSLSGLFGGVLGAVVTAALHLLEAGMDRLIRWIPWTSRRRRAWVRAEPDATEVRFADAVNRYGRTWLVCSRGRVAVYWLRLEGMGRDGLEQSFQAEAPRRLVDDRVRWTDGGLVTLPRWVIADAWG